MCEVVVFWMFWEYCLFVWCCGMGSWLFVCVLWFWCWVLVMGWENVEVIWCMVEWMNVYEFVCGWSLLG